MADRAGNIAPESRMQGVILSETARRPRCGRRRLFRGKADRRNRCGTTRQAAPAATQAGIPRIQKPWSGPNGSGKRSGATAGDKQPAARNRQWTTTNKRRAMNDGRRKGQRRQTGQRSQAAKKQACATAGPTTRPEGRHTIFISARPEYASQRRESSYRPA